MIQYGFIENNYVLGIIYPYTILGITLINCRYYLDVIGYIEECQGSTYLQFNKVIPRCYHT